MGLSVYCGDDRTLTATCTLNNAPLSLAGILGATFLVKQRLEDVDSMAVITKTLTTGSGITVTDAPGGIMTITLNALETVNEPSRSLFCTLKLKDPSSKIITGYNDRLILTHTAADTTH